MFVRSVGAIVCTIEKANAWVVTLLEEDAIDRISAVIIDELHMVGDDDRGYLLELLLTKLRFTTAPETLQVRLCQVQVHQVSSVRQARKGASPTRFR